MKKIRTSQHSAKTNIHGNRFISFSFNYLSFVPNKQNKLQYVGVPSIVA